MKKLHIKILFLLASIFSTCANAVEFSAFADLLVWHASQQTCSTWANIVSKPANNTVDFDATNVNFGWNPGFRGGLAYLDQSTILDSSLYWTHYSANTSNSHAIAEQLLLPEFFSGFLSGNYFFGGTIDWKLLMNMLDLEVGRKFSIGKSVSIRPKIGIKGGTIKQTANCAWKADIYTATEQVIHNFTGVGPTFGIDSNWNIFRSFNLIGNFATTFMYGNWKLNDVYIRPRAGLITPTTITTSLNQTQLGTLMFDYFMGLEWKFNGKANVSLQVGYEMQYWANQLRLPTFQQLPVHGDLTLQGGTCHIRIEL